MNRERDLDREPGHEAGDAASPAGTSARKYCVHTLFEQQADRDPDAVALVAEAHADDRADAGADAGAVADAFETISYRELNSRANRLARYLREHGVEPGDRVGLRMVRSVDCVVAMLAVLKAGGAYVPLESGFPPARLAQIAAECGIRVVLAGPGLTWDVAESSPSEPSDSDARAVVLRPAADEDAARIAALPDTNLGLQLSPELTMYVPFTSGSTGTPKGTDVPHRALPGFFAGDDYAQWGPGRAGLLHSALSWDGHLLDLYPSLLTGGRVVVAPARLRDPAEICGLARRTGVTTLWLSAQAFNTVVDVDPDLLGGLNCLVIGGEVLSVQHVRKACEALPQLRIVNGYGPSECTVFSCVHPITPADLADGGAIPIGRPVGDRRIYVLDDDGEPVADGEIGELHVGGPAVAHGYIGRPALTAERFVPDPFSGEPGAKLYRTGDRARRRPDGLLEFHGRGDGQIKLRGFRVELSEVEAALRAHPQVADCAVMVDDSGPSPRLVAYVVPSAGAGPAAAAVMPADLDTHARQLLHAAMVPGLYIELDRLPLSRTGKLDRAALPAPPRTAQAPIADHELPRTETERLLAGIWAGLLGLPSGTVGHRDRFFDRGGDSLTATRVIARVRPWAGGGVSVTDLYDKPVLADFAALLDARAALRDTAPAAPPALRAHARVAL